MARALAAAIVALAIVAVAHGGGTATPKRGGTLAIARPPGLTCLNLCAACNLNTNDPALSQVLEDPSSSHVVATVIAGGVHPRERA